jgi:D-alanyl-D-alanine carboxypeptidase/D-alanyl-D-alanine-endopeptidase (penicillin-binding protein 4)
MIRTVTGWRPLAAFAVLLLVGAILVGTPVSGLTPWVSAASDNPLGQDLDSILADQRLRGADVGLVVRKADTGEVLYSSQSSRRGQPGSTSKLISTAAAMDVLGMDYRFTTSVHAGGQRAGRTLNGDLFLRGTGDPTMLAADYDALAQRVAASGIGTVRGRLVADDTWFDDIRLATGWAWDDEPYYYNAQISALTVAPDTDYDAGSVIVGVAPSTAGAPAAVRIDPPNRYVQIVNTAVTGPPGSARTIVVDRRHGDKTITVSGAMPADGAELREYMTVWEPTDFVASLFRDALARHGVAVLGPTTRGATPPNLPTLADRTSMPLGELATPLLKLSNNMHAEALVKAAGRASSGAGTWHAGLAALAGKYDGLGVDPATVYFTDGSGLSRMDHVSPDQLASVLVAARTKPWFAAWYQALPVAGIADRMVGGTLRNRMRGTPAEGRVHAKTGSMTGMSGLAGYVTAANGEELVFAMITNNYLGGPVRPLEDAVAIRLASYLGDADVRTPMVVTVAPQTEQGRRADLECSWVKAC